MPLFRGACPDCGGAALLRHIEPRSRSSALSIQVSNAAFRDEASHVLQVPYTELAPSIVPFLVDQGHRNETSRKR